MALSIRQEVVFRRIGESLREAGLLVLVFGLLDEFHRATPGAPASVRWVAVVVALAAGGIASGILVEALLVSSSEAE